MKISWNHFIIFSASGKALIYKKAMSFLYFQEEHRLFYYIILSRPEDAVYSAGLLEPSRFRCSLFPLSTQEIREDHQAVSIARDDRPVPEAIDAQAQDDPQKISKADP